MTADINEELLSFIAASPTPYHAVAEAARRLKAAGFTALAESAEWKPEPGKGYYVTRNGSSLIAFRVPAGEPAAFMMAAAHGDTPCLKIKENPELAGGDFVRLSTEKYGGMLCAPWLDRPLAVAGRLLCRTKAGVKTVLVDTGAPVALIPNVAIHMNRNANDGMSFNAAVDMIPLYGGPEKAGTFKGLVADAAGVAEEEILATDLFLYDPEPGRVWNGFVSSPRLDDLQCAFSALGGFLEASPADGVMPVYCLFDNEEVGSTTKQGAASTFLKDVLLRAALALGLTEDGYRRLVASSMLLSCDNAHSVHPNHPEHADKNHTVKMNGGVVIKYNANQKYTSDAVSAGIFRLICDEAGVPVQYYANRADMAGGSTLGNIANTQVSLNTVDIGLAQLAMHSCYETAGAMDTGYMVRAITAFYSRRLIMRADGEYALS